MAALVKEVDSSTIIDNAKFRPDFILVVDNSTATDEKIDKVLRFLAELRSIGIQHDSEEFSGNKDLGFIKLYAPEIVLLKQADDLNIELACFTLPEFKPPDEKPKWKFMRNELNDLQPNGLVEKRAPNLHNVNSPLGITTAERILVLFTILNTTRFGKGKLEAGLESLLECGAVKDAFPLHDGTHHWSETGRVNERQLLTRYWSRMSCFRHSQPLDVINHYFGTSTGFYFAWLGFYNKMLMYISIIGVVFFVLGLVTFRSIHTHITKEICSSSLSICPRCQILAHCGFKNLSGSCFQATYSHAFGNPMSFLFSVVMGFWAVLFLRKWMRRERVLQLRWNVKDLEIDSTLRFGFVQRASTTRKSPITGLEVPHISKIEAVGFHFLSLFIMLVMVAINAFVIVILLLWSHYLVIIIGKHAPSHFIQKHDNTIASIISAVVTVGFIVIYESAYRHVALKLTMIENPRSQIDFENSYVVKVYILAFVNNYTGVFYVAFFKGRFFTYPGDQQMYERHFGIGTDICDVFGCIWDLGLLLTVTLLLKKSALMHLIHWIKWNIINKLRARQKAAGFMRLFKRFTYDKTKQWEREFMLEQDSNMEVLEEYLEMAIQYGFVTFFAACYPLAPLLAWLNNIVELRLDARKKTVEKRRIVPIKIMGIGAWHVIFQAATIISFITNALVMSFTSDMFKRIVYMREMHTLKGYVQFSLSVFDTTNFADVEFNSSRVPYCYYPGHKFGPDNDKQYMGTKFFPYLFTVNVIFIVMFVHIMFLISAVITHFTPATPFSVKQLVNFQEDYLADLKKKSTGHDLIDANRRNSV